MLKIAWNLLTMYQREFVNNLIRDSLLDIVRVDEIQRLIDKGLFKNSNNVTKIFDIGQSVLSHHCTPRCLVMVDEDKYVCRKTNYLTMNPPPGNTRSMYKILSNDMSIETLRRL